jgi:hypothetical protein
MQAQGAKGEIRLGFETTYGTTPTSPAMVEIPFNTESLKASAKLTEDSTIRGNKNPSEPTYGNQDVSGSITGPIDQVAIGWILRALLGDPTKTGTADPYTHVFKLGAAMPSLFIEKAFTDVNQFFLYNGVKPNKFSFEMGGDGELNYSIDLMGAKETQATSSTDATALDHANNHVKFGQFQGYIKEGGSNLAIVTKASLEVSTNLDGNQIPIGAQGVRAGIPEGIATVTGSVTLFFQDASYYTKAINGTKTSLEFGFTAGSNRSLAFLLPEVKLERNTPTIDGPTGIVVEMPYRAFFSSATEATALQVTLKNGFSDYTTIPAS